MGVITNELREKYLKTTVHAFTIYDRIEQLIAELELIEERMDKKLFLKTVREFKTRIESLRKNMETSTLFLFSSIDATLSEINTILLSITTYKDKMREKGLTESDERAAIAATQLHINAVKKQKRIRDRRKNIEKIEADRKGRIQRSRTLRNKEKIDA